MVVGSSSDDEPVAVNVVALIDILMCLLLFYMCASKFAPTEGRLDAWLPKDVGIGEGPPKRLPLDEIRIRLAWESGSTVRRFGDIFVTEDGELKTRVVNQATLFRSNATNGTPQPPVVVESQAAVPWFEVVRVLDLCREAGMTKIEFSFKN